MHIPGKHLGVLDCYMRSWLEDKAMKIFKITVTIWLLIVLILKIIDKFKIASYATWKLNKLFYIPSTFGKKSLQQPHRNKTKRVS